MDRIYKCFEELVQSLSSTGLYDRKSFSLQICPSLFMFARVALILKKHRQTSDVEYIIVHLKSVNIIFDSGQWTQASFMVWRETFL